MRPVSDQAGIVRAVIGALMMGVTNHGMVLTGTGAHCQQAIKGLVLPAAVVFDVLNRSKLA